MAGGEKEMGDAPKKKQKKVKNKGSRHPGAGTPKPKLTKQERRELQEKQRAEKDARGGGKKKPQPKGPLQHDDASRMAKKSKNRIVERTVSQKQVAYFSHLAQYERESSLSLNTDLSEESAAKVHPAILSLGLKLGDNVLDGANSRTVGMLRAFEKVITEYECPPGKALARDLDKKLRPLIQFLIDCRPLSLAMGNAIKALKMKVLNMDPNLSQEEAKRGLLEFIEDYVRTNITLAQQEVIKHGLTKVADNDTVLTFGNSQVILELLLTARRSGKTNVRVVVVGSRGGAGDPAVEILHRLADAGFHCTYVLLTSMSYVMTQVTKVFLSAEAVLSNGVVLGPAGTAAVALVANAYKKPVLVCCETYKFSARVQLDSICWNELGDPDDLIQSSMQDGGEIKRSPLYDWRDLPSMKLLNLRHDVTAMDHISAIVTELGLIPPTSVPVVVRERALEEERLFQ